ncbi:MAG: NAD(P)H-dependent oxidoreductase [Candidatus Latescibacterota bacterium]|nr:MAG: NAD(P)H-dependent oxidoreductase [Candidatus Latescibacterota bacterium]
MTDAHRKILVLFAHPALQKSRVNRALIRGLDVMDGVTFHDLYERYPRLEIDVRHEQELLLQHDIVVLQHPFYWYSTPAILKEYQDLVLEHGWAYGREGRALRGKILLNALTAGGSEEVYCAQGRNRYTVRRLLAPIEQTASLCGMRYLAPFVVHGTHALDAAEIELHRRDYHRLLEALRDDRVDLDAAARATHVNADIDAIVRTHTH